jgi:enoyl-CoA hydratase/carnithine racemase
MWLISRSRNAVRVEENSMPEKLNLSREGDVLVITFDNPPTNAIGPQMLSELEASLDEFWADSTCRVAILASANRGVFLSGADVPVFAAMVESGGIREYIPHGQALFRRISASPKPVIAAMDGLVLGGGLELAMACHLRVASERARFGLPEIHLGIIPGWGGTQMLARLIGRARATEFILLGETIHAQEALRINLVNKVVPRGEVLAAAKDLAKKFAARSLPATTAAMESIRAAVEMDPDEGFALETRQMLALFDTQDVRETIQVILAKQNPVTPEK